MLVSVSMVESAARALVFQSAAPVAALGPWWRVWLWALRWLRLACALAPLWFPPGMAGVAALGKQCVGCGIYGFLICLPVCLVS